MRWSQEVPVNLGGSVILWQEIKQLFEPNLGNISKANIKGSNLQAETSLPYSSIFSAHKNIVIVRKN